MSEAIRLLLPFALGLVLDVEISWEHAWLILESFPDFPGKCASYPSPPPHRSKYLHHLYAKLFRAAVS